MCVVLASMPGAVAWEKVLVKVGAGRYPPRLSAEIARILRIVQEHADQK
jgi:hypothetical protein